MFSGVSTAGRAVVMFSAMPTLVPPRPLRAHRLDGKAVAEHGVVAHLVEPRPGQDEAGREHAVAVAQLDEGADLVQGEEVADPVARACAATKPA